MAITIDELKRSVFPGESGGDYNALYGYANRPGGQFAGVNLTDMTLGDVLQFTDPRGPYAQWVKGQVGRVATPTGAFQAVGTTLRGAVDAMGLPLTQKYDPTTQDAIGMWIYQNQGPGAWEAWGKGGGATNNTTVTSKGGAPMGLLDMRAEQAPQTFGQKFKAGLKDGSFFDNLAVGFNGLRMNPDQGLNDQVALRQERRQQDAVANRTVAWLQSMGTPQALQAAEALATGSIDAGSAVQYALAKPEDNRTALQQNIEYFMSMGMTLDDAMKAVQGASGGTTVNMGEPLKIMTDGRIAVADPNADGGVRFVTPPGSQAAIEAETAGQKVDQKAQNAQVYGDAAIVAIDQLIGGPGKAGMIDDGAGAFNVSNVGIVGDRLAKMGLSQSSVDVRNTLEAVTSNIAFGRLQAMRDASATGGALGSVTENELNMLMNSLGAVRSDTSAELLRQNLATIRNIWTKINSDPVARSFYYGAGGQAGAPAAGGAGADDGFTVTGQF